MSFLAYTHRVYLLRKGLPWKREKVIFPTLEEDFKWWDTFQEQVWEENMETGIFDQSDNVLVPD